MKIEKAKLEQLSESVRRAIFDNLNARNKLSNKGWGHFQKKIPWNRRQTLV